MQDSAPKPPHTLPGPIALYRGAIELYQKHLWTYFFIALVPFVFNIFSTPTNTSLLWLRFTLQMVASSLSTLTLIYLLKYAASKNSLRVAFSSAVKRFFPYIWLQFILMLTLSGGFFLFLIPIFYVATIYSQSLFIFALEHESGFRALLKSKEYVKGRFWQVFGRMVVYSMVNIILMVISVAVYNSLLDTNIQTIGYFITPIIFAMVTPMQILYLYRLYTELQKQKTVDVLPSSTPAILLMIWGIIAPILLFALGFGLQLLTTFARNKGY